MASLFEWVFDKGNAEQEFQASAMTLQRQCSCGQERFAGAIIESASVDDFFDLIINQRLGYPRQQRGECVGLLRKFLRIGLLQLRQVMQLPAYARQVFQMWNAQQ